MAEPVNPLRVRLSPRMRLQWEKAQGAHVLLYPEGVVQLNESAAVILELCDGSRTADQVVGELAQRFDAPGLAEDVSEFIVAARSHGWIVDA
jgi:pyrroloquinoline quinone biosynthesis protein D